MNGRIYDPLLGRMLSADLVVDNPGDLQGYNRYSYVKNRPLTLVDPSGWSGLTPTLPLWIPADNWLSKSLADGVTESFNAGKAHAEAGAQEFANSSNSSTPGLDRTIGALHMVGVVAAAVDIAATVTPEGKAEKLATEGVEKLATKAESAVAHAVEKVEGKAATIEKRVEGVAASADSKVSQAAPAAEIKGGTKKETGSYTNHHESGKTYDGKGSKERSQTSARRVEKDTGDKHVATEWAPAKDERGAFKDESKRLDSHGGAKSDGNHNQIESPGKKKRIEDGEL